MDLTVQKVSAGFQDLEKLEVLNQEAFPEEERMPIQEMIDLSERGKIEVWAFYDGQQFIGFYAVAVRKPVGYILFFAVSRKHRSKGYGGKALALMEKQYSDCQIVLDMEPVEAAAVNLGQRVSRKSFYLRNGFYETGYLMGYKGLKMEILCNQDSFRKTDFEALLKNLKIREIPFQIWKKEE